jgi:MOSC domain-containing protein YiiM
VSKVVQILISKSPESAMEPQDSAHAIPGQGLKGDRYYHGKGTFSPPRQEPDYELTLIEEEKIKEFVRESGVPFTPLQARRNVVTSGIELNGLVGREFLIGTVRVKGIRLCEPCNYLAKKSFSQVLRGFVHKSGLRAQILTEGVINVGDVIKKPE